MSVDSGVTSGDDGVSSQRLGEAVTGDDFPVCDTFLCLEKVLTF